MRGSLLFLLAALTCSAVFGQHEFTVYELLPPDTHRFSIIYDVSTSREGAKFYLNPIRPGSKVSDERVIDLATGKILKFENVDGKTAKAAGIRPASTPDDALFLKVNLAAPVPKDGEARIRIYKVYEDAPSYFAQGDRLVFDRPLGIRREVIVPPTGYWLVVCSCPSIVATHTELRSR